MRPSHTVIWDGRFSSSHLSLVVVVFTQPRVATRLCTSVVSGWGGRRPKAVVQHLRMPASEPSFGDAKVPESLRRCLPFGTAQTTLIIASIESAMFCAVNWGIQMKPLMVLLALTTIITMGAMAQQTTYSYIGAPMKGTLSPGTSPGPNDDTHLIGTIVLSAPLKPYKSSQIVVPITYSFNSNSALSNTWRDNPTLEGTYSGQLFSFDTDQNGDIIGWTVVIASTTLPTLVVNENIGMTSVANNAGGSYDGYSYTFFTM